MEKEKSKIILKSFIDGLGKKDISDINNAVYIAQKQLGLGITIEFDEEYRTGVESYKLNGILICLESEGGNEKVYEIGRRMSRYNPTELAWMALYLWNQGRSVLYNDERDIAKKLLEHEFGYRKNET